MKNLSNCAEAVLMALREAAKQSPDGVVPISTAALVVAVGYTRPAIQNALKRLEAEGLIKFIERPRQGRRLFTIKML